MIQNQVLCLWVGWQPPGLLCSIPELRAGCGRGRRAQGGPAFSAVPCKGTSTIPPTETTERCWQKGSSLFSKTTWKTSCFSPGPPLFLPATGTALFWWYWWAWDEITDKTLVNKNGRIFLVIWFYRVQIFKQPKYGRIWRMVALGSGLNAQGRICFSDSRTHSFTIKLQL